jgi:hypothetical protein
VLRCYDTKFHEEWFRYSKVDTGGYAGTQTDAERFMKYAVEMCSGVMIYKLNGFRKTQIYRQHGDHINLLSLF